MTRESYLALDRPDQPGASLTQEEEQALPVEVRKVPVKPAATK